MRYALRSLAKSPGFTAVIVLSLAVGIGANTVVFSWLKSALLNPLPGVTTPVQLLETLDDTGNYVSTSWLEYKDLRELTPSFAAIAAQRQRSFYLGDSERDTRAFGECVSENFFAVLGVRPQLGRFFLPDEATRPGSAPVVVLSHDFWQSRFKGDPAAVGQTLKLNGRTLTIIGVAPHGFRGGMNNMAFDVFVPLTMATELLPATSELRDRSNRPYVMLALLKPGVTRARAQGELDAAAQQLIATYPETNKGLGYRLLPTWRSPRGGETIVTSLSTLQIFSTLILVVVCANTANLLLARASTRQREIGVRLAIGAGPGRIVAQLLGESVLVALLGAALGLLVALWGVAALAQLPLPGNLPLRVAPELDWSSALFAIGLGSLCGIAFGLAPALQLARADVLQSLRGGRGVLGGRSRLRDALVGLEVAVALVVLVLAGLFLKSFRNAQHADPGFEPQRTMLATLDFGGRGYDRKSAARKLDEILARLGEQPGIARAAASNFVPLDIRGTSTGVIDVIGHPFDSSRKILYCMATDGYFDAMGIPFLEGGDLAPFARTDLPLDAVISAEMARRYWPGESAVGRRFEVDGDTFVVAGVVRDVKMEKLTESPRPAAWLTLRRQFAFLPMLAVRTTGADARALLHTLRATVRQLDPELAVLDVRTMAQHLDNNLFIQRVPAHMLAVLGPLALALAAIGLYAVLAYAVAQRAQEIGVRLALGATPPTVVRLVMWQSMKVVLAATALGWSLALGLGWFLRPFFVGVSFGDPLVYAGVPALLLAVATLACWLPARRAAKVDPMVALRAE
ncbi:MAG: ABC transporter permease [Opitutaceae bacterium]